jgi:hypothetical protein
MQRQSWQSRRIEVAADELQGARDHLRLVVDELQAKDGGRGRLGASIAATDGLELELVRLRKALEEKRSEIDRLRDAAGAAGLAERQCGAGAERSWTPVWPGRAWSGRKPLTNRKRPSAGCAPSSSSTSSLCETSVGEHLAKRRTYPGHCPIGRSCTRRRYPNLLCSAVGESQWEYLVKSAGFPSWRTIRSWRADLLGEMGMGHGRGHL